MIAESIMCALTLWFEARGEPLAGKMAVASTYVNRAAIHRTTIRKQLLRPAQYSCWNSFSGKHRILKEYNSGKIHGPAWEECKKVSNMIYDKTLPKTSFTHYYNPKKVKKDSEAWEWIKGLKNKKQIGNHIFGSCK